MLKVILIAIILFGSFAFAQEMAPGNIKAVDTTMQINPDKDSVLISLDREFQEVQKQITIAKAQMYDLTEQLKLLYAQTEELKRKYQDRYKKIGANH